jgi:hypothetical protein
MTERYTKKDRREAQHRANAGIPVIDPMTGQLIPAGQYSQDDWRVLSRANPDLATALIENRYLFNDAAQAEKDKRSAYSLAGAAVAAGGLAGTIDQARVNRKLVDILNWQQSGLATPGMPIYASEKAWVTVPAPGVIEFDSVLDPGSREAVSEALKARAAFNEIKEKPEGQKLYRAVAHDPDPVRQMQKEDILKKMGFQDTGRNVFRFDARPGAKQFHNFYAVGDRAAQFATKNFDLASKGIRYGGATLLGLGVGALGHSLWNMINPVEEL